MLRHLHLRSGAMELSPKPNSNSEPRSRSPHWTAFVPNKHYLQDQYKQAASCSSLHLQCALDFARRVLENEGAPEWSEAETAGVATTVSLPTAKGLPPAATFLPGQSLLDAAAEMGDDSDSTSASDRDGGCHCDSSDDEDEVEADEEFVDCMSMEEDEEEVFSAVDDVLQLVLIDLADELDNAPEAVIAARHVPEQAYDDAKDGEELGGWGIKLMTYFEEEQDPTARQDFCIWNMWDRLRTRLTSVARQVLTTDGSCFDEVDTPFHVLAGRSTPLQE